MYGATLLPSIALAFLFFQDSYSVRMDQPRILIEDVKAMAKSCEGPLAGDYKVAKDRTDPPRIRISLRSISDRRKGRSEASAQAPIRRAGGRRQSRGRRLLAYGWEPAPGRLFL
jgi:hypothetical protein